MGNCFRSDSAGEQGRGEVGFDDSDELVKRMRKLKPSNLQEKRRVVRIKVVVTREELDQIMKCSSNISSSKGNYLKGSSVEKLVGAMKLRGTRVYEVGTKDDNNRGGSSNWKPALESIPEDH